MLLERVGDSQPAAPTAVDELGLGAGKAKVLGTPACDEYREALDAYRSLCVDAEHARSHALLRALLELYGDRYERLKRERSGLDFEDLELLARDLLARDEGLRDQLRERYAHVMVDEFQDVNPLQSELLGLVARDNLFRVGDENQSIYGFRHADVEVFRRHRDQAAEEGRALGVTVNFRSRGELVDAVALGFERLWGEGYEPLREAPGARDPAPDRPLVDLLVVDGHKGRWDDALPPEDGALGAAMAGVAPWRALEARLLAKRIDELTGDDGPYEFRDVVVLLRATTSMSVYERALVERGIPTHVVGGRGYWSQQQVSDLRHWLTALANPLDELALYSVLASPLAGLALDSVALVALHAREARKDPMWALREGVAGAEGGLAEVLPPADLARARDVPRALRRRARRGAARGARDADRPGGHEDGLRPPPAGAPGGRAAHGERAQADAHGARVRGRRGPRPARLHRRDRRPRRAPGARGRGAARGRDARRRPAHDDPPRKGARVPGGGGRRPRQDRA